MRFLRLAALIVAITGGYLGLAGGLASATPLSSGALAPGAAQVASPLLEKSQFYFGVGPGYGYQRPYYARPAYGYRRPYYARPVYGYRRPYYARPRVVCRVRYGYYGPRRVCVRRF